MTRYFLVRHGMCDAVGKYIAGRKKGISLNPTGKHQIEMLATKLKDIPVSALYTGPLERTVETAEIIGKQINVKPVVCEELDEVDYGKWTGMAFKELSCDPLWKEFNEAKGRFQIPGGEMMIEVQARICNYIERKRKLFNGNIITVSHCDTIKTAIINYAGFPLDMINRFSIDTASITILETSDYGPVLNGVNCNVDEIQYDCF